MKLTYTVEASVGGYIDASGNFVHFTIDKYKQIGRCLLKGLYETVRIGLTRTEYIDTCHQGNILHLKQCIPSSSPLWASALSLFDVKQRIQQATLETEPALEEGGSDSESEEDDMSKKQKRRLLNKIEEIIEGTYALNETTQGAKVHMPKRLGTRGKSKTTGNFGASSGSSNLRAGVNPTRKTSLQTQSKTWGNLGQQQQRQMFKITARGDEGLTGNKKPALQGGKGVKGTVSDTGTNIARGQSPDLKPYLQKTLVKPTTIPHTSRIPQTQKSFAVSTSERLSLTNQMFARRGVGYVGSRTAEPSQVSVTQLVHYQSGLANKGGLGIQMKRGLPNSFTEADYQPSYTATNFSRAKQALAGEVVSPTAAAAKKEVRVANHLLDGAEFLRLLKETQDRKGLPTYIPPGVSGLRAERSHVLPPTPWKFQQAYTGLRINRSNNLNNGGVLPRG